MIEKRKKMALRFAYCALFFHVLLLMSGHVKGNREARIQEHFHKNVVEVAKDRSFRLYYKILNELFKRPASNTGPPGPPGGSGDDSGPSELGLPGKRVEFDNFVFDYIEASYIGLFTPDDVYFGKVMPIYFPVQDNSSHLPFTISKEMVDSSITYPLSDLTKLFKPSSTLQDFPLKDQPDDKKCKIDYNVIWVRNMESISEFISCAFRSEGSFRIVETKQAEMSTASLQEYVVLQEPQEIQGPRKVFCHPVKDTFCCHYSAHTKVLNVLLGTQNGDKMETIAVCHTNTAAQNPDDILHRLLRVKPGTIAPVCHFLPSGHFVWVQSPTLNN